MYGWVDDHLWAVPVATQAYLHMPGETRSSCSQKKEIRLRISTSCSDSNLPTLPQGHGDSWLATMNPELDRTARSSDRIALLREDMQRLHKEQLEAVTELRSYGRTCNGCGAVTELRSHWEDMQRLHNE